MVDKYEAGLYLGYSVVVTAPTKRGFGLARFQAVVGLLRETLELLSGCATNWNGEDGIRDEASWIEYVYKWEGGIWHLRKNIRYH